MTPLFDIFDQSAQVLLAGLLRASVQGGVLAILIWIACRLFPRVPPSVRCLLWWLAALKLVVALAWIEPVPIPVLPPVTAPSISSPLPLSGPPAPADAAPVNFPGRRTGNSASWTFAAAALWAAGVAFLLVIAACRIGGILRIAARASSAPPETRSLAEELSGLLGLARVPEVRISGEIDTPLVIGFCRRLVLLPDGGFRTLSPAGRRMALCHELVHLRRGDPWLAAIPALAERLFFFHPLAHLAVREYGLAREAACDAAVLRRLDAPPAEYGRLLLTLGVARMPRHFAAAGAPNSYSNLKRRIIMLGNPSRIGRSLRVAAVGVTVLAIGAIMPVKFVARPVEALTTSGTAFTPAAWPLTAAAESVAAPAPAAEVLAPQAVPPRAEELNYVFFTDGKGRMMSGTDVDVARAGQFRKAGEPMLWFRRNGREYVVRDPGILAEVEAIFKPVAEIGRKQGEVGSRQGEIGARQGEIGGRQGEIGARQGEIGARQARIAALQANLAAKEAALAAARIDRNNSAGQVQELEKSHRELEAQMQAMNAQMKELSAQMRSLNEPMNELGKQMEGLSREMEALSRHMKEVSTKANEDLRRLLDRAIAGGTAIEVKGSR